MFLGFTKTVLLCMALEYSEMGVSWMLCFFFPTSGFTSRFSS